VGAASVGEAGIGPWGVEEFICYILTIADMFSKRFKELSLDGARLLRNQSFVRISAVLQVVIVFLAISIVALVTGLFKIWHNDFWHNDFWHNLDAQDPVTFFGRALALFLNVGPLLATCVPLFAAVRAGRPVNRFRATMHRHVQFYRTRCKMVNIPAELQISAPALYFFVFFSNCHQLLELWFLSLFTASSANMTVLWLKVPTALYWAALIFLLYKMVRMVFTALLPKPGAPVVHKDEDAALLRPGEGISNIKFEKALERETDLERHVESLEAELKRVYAKSALLDIATQREATLNAQVENLLESEAGLKRSLAQLNKEKALTKSTHTHKIMHSHTHTHTRSLFQTHTHTHTHTHT
jgi:hypothetical protein